MACSAQLPCTVGESTAAASTDPLAADNSNVLKAKPASPSMEINSTLMPGSNSMAPIKIGAEVDGYISYFDYDSAVLQKPVAAGLLFVADYLKANPTFQILIEGHCDERGTRDYNIALGHKRADAVRKQLARMGVDQRRITTKSFGKERPAMRGASPEIWAKNRRTVIRIRGE